MTKTKNRTENAAPDRRRGRPVGKNRVPLSLEEKRARNALYERERRNQTADAMAELAAAVGCVPNIANADLLATVISEIQSRTRSSDETIDEISRINGNLESQILMLQDRLGIDDEGFDQLDDNKFQPIASHSKSQPASNTKHLAPNKLKKSKNKRKKSSRLNAEYSLPQEKRAKTKSETSADSGVESQTQSVSPVNVDEAEDVESGTDDHQVLSGGSHFQAELRSEFYDQIFGSGSSTSESSKVESDSTHLAVPLMERLTRSLFTVLPITPPQEPSGFHVEPPKQPAPKEIIDETRSTNMTDNNIETIPRDESMFNLMTDNEKRFVNEWLEKEYLGTSEDNDQTTLDEFKLMGVQLAKHVPRGGRRTARAFASRRDDFTGRDCDLYKLLF